MWVIVNQFSADVFREGRIDEVEESVTEENVTVGRIPEERVIEERHYL